MKQKSWNQQGAFDESRFITYFVEFIPDDWDSGKLFRVVNRWVNVIDAFIPLKRSVSNTRFGFLRFARAFEKERQRLDMLNAKSFDGVSLKLNFARFGNSSRNQGRGIYSKQRIEQRKPDKLIARSSGIAQGARGDSERNRHVQPTGLNQRSFADVVINKKMADEGQAEPVLVLGSVSEGNKE